MKRRDFLLSSIFGAGAVGLRALASGLPPALLLHPERVLAQGLPAAAMPQFLILSTSYYGDGLNANVPGTYEDAGIAHPPSPSMAPAPLTLGPQTVTAAAPWAALAESTLARTCFFHHATQTSIHSDEPSVLRLHGALTNNDMLVSALAVALAPQLNTIVSQPLCLGAASAAEALTAQGSPQAMLSPRHLAQVLTSPDTPLRNLQALRDQTLDQMNAWFKTRGGGAAQAIFIDKYATSQAELRSLSQNLLGNLAQVTSDGPSGQIAAAVALIQMRVAPVMTMHIPFGGDNHTDPELSNEAAQTVYGVSTLASLMQALTSAQLSDQVTFASLNVFGRTLALSHKGINGRDHNPFHQCSLLMGKHIAPSVVGGVTPTGGDYGALPIDPVTGRGDPNAGITPQDSMTAFGMTLATALGLSPETVAATFYASTAKVVQAALVSG